MKLPAGPITVYDGGAYAGDALTAFFPVGAKRLVNYGEDLGVTASSTGGDAREVASVTVSKGVLTINHRLVYQRDYRIHNDGDGGRTLILEHAITPGTELAAPQPTERTSSLYRFEVPLEAGKTAQLTVRESRPVAETLVLGSLRVDTLAAYSTNGSIPAAVKAALQRAVTLRLAWDKADAAQRDLQSQREVQVVEQERIRRNLSATGTTTPQGQLYLTRLAALDDQIDALAAQITAAQTAARQAQEAWSAYIAGLEL
jgi:molybdenum-dependent DNA-binding transcriptional regulator ModE